MLAESKIISKPRRQEADGTNNSLGVADESIGELQVHQNDVGERVAPLTRAAINHEEIDVLEGNEELEALSNPIIYVRGVPNDNFYLILQGKVNICSGNEGFMIEQTTFNYMGVECLTNDRYVPDFSAKVIGHAKLLKISREDYRRALGHAKN